MHPQGTLVLQKRGVDACAAPSVIPIVLVHIKCLRYLQRAFPYLHWGMPHANEGNPLPLRPHSITDTAQRQRSSQEVH